MRTAAERAEAVEVSHSIANHTVAFRFASSALAARFLPAFSHLPETTGAPSLTVCLWDSARPGSPPPPQPDVDATGNPRGAIWISEASDLRSAFQPSVCTFSVLDGRTDTAYFWTPDGSSLPWRECASPLRLPLHWWMAAHGHQLVHAGAVGNDAGALLIVGRSGSGKSTTALACADAGLRYVSDDEVLIELDPVPYCHSIYNSGKLEAHHIQRFPGLLRGIVNDDALAEDKAILFMHALAAEQVSTGLPVVGVLVPRIVDRELPEARETRRATALMALAPSTVFQLPGERGASLQTMARLVERLPCYELLLGRDIDGIGGVVTSLLDRLTAR